jgi:hypothetical protein
MKPPFSTALLTITLLLLTVLITSGCKQKGCTDKNALNYNSVAEEDDGSCVYCKTQSSITDTANKALYDDNYDQGNNPYYGNEVAFFKYTSSFISHNSNKCGNDFCTVSVTIHNLISKTIIFNGQFSLNAEDTIINNISVPAGGITNLGIIFSNPSTGSCIQTPFTNFNLTDTISYH